MPHQQLGQRRRPPMISHVRNEFLGMKIIQGKKGSSVRVLSITMIILWSEVLVVLYGISKKLGRDVPMA